MGRGVEVMGVMGVIVDWGCGFWVEGMDSVELID